MNAPSLYRARALSAMVAATLVAACGGGSSDEAALPPVAGPPPAPATVAITGKAVDGPLQGATACYDTSNNGDCESSEPTSAASGTDGSFTIPGVPAAAAGQHRVVVKVPATAIDADTGAAVGRAFTLIAPATGTAGAHSVFVSPLTTLVQKQMDIGQTKEEAVSFVQTNLALAVSPLADFTAATNPDNTKAANAARLLLATESKQATALAPARGQTDLTGGTVSQADLDAAVAKTLVASLPLIGVSAADASLAGKTGSDLVTAVAALATTVVAEAGVTVPELVAAIGVGKLPPEPASSAAPAPGGTFAAIRYASASNWNVRANLATAADATPDANGLTRYYEQRQRAEGYAFAAGSPAVVGWGFNNDPARSGDLWWNGSGWVGCPLGTRSSGTPRDANGRSSYNYCNGYEKGTSVRSALDVSGQPMADVLTQKIRTLPGGSSGVNFADWGPQDLTLLAGATFPAGSTLYYQTLTPLESAPAYTTLGVDVVTVYTQAIADGGDGRTGNPAPACFEANPVPVPATSLEQMIARAPGKPCISNPQTNADGTSLSPNEAWFATAVSMGANQGNFFPTLPAGTGNYYNHDARLRVSFTGTGNGTVYYACYTRRTPISTRNCQTLGSGTYAIVTLGDARVMTLTNLPAALQRQGWDRVFVERGGQVHYGYRNKVGGSFPQVRLNLTAGNAMLAQLGMPILTPTDSPNTLPADKAANAAMMKGVWTFTDAAGTGILRVGDNGEYVTAITDAPSGTGRPGFEYGRLEVNSAGKLSRQIVLDADGSSGLSHFDFASTVAVTGTSFTTTLNGVTQGFDGRLPDPGTGIVGMWAIGSPTDLKVTQFVFFANGKVLSIHPAETQGPCVAARLGPPGIEWSDYTFNPTTGALQIFNKIYDTSGCTGVFDPTGTVPITEANLVLTMAADGKTFTVPVDGGTVTLTGYRIAPNP